jgi:hypothetical protein
MIHKFILSRAECGCILAGIADDGSTLTVSFISSMRKLGHSVEHVSISGINPGPQLHVCTHEKAPTSYRRRLGHLTRNNRGE